MAWRSGRRESEAISDCFGPPPPPARGVPSRVIFARVVCCETQATRGDEFHGGREGSCLFVAVASRHVARRRACFFSRVVLFIVKQAAVLATIPSAKRRTHRSSVRSPPTAHPAAARDSKLLFLSRTTPAKKQLRGDTHRAALQSNHARALNPPASARSSNRTAARERKERKTVAGHVVCRRRRTKRARARERTAAAPPQWRRRRRPRPPSCTPRCWRSGTRRASRTCTFTRARTARRCSAGC